VKPYSLDEHWEMLLSEYNARGRPVPRVDLAFYRLALRWLRARLRRATRT
jgi:hypothetical protein